MGREFDEQNLLKRELEQQTCTPGCKFPLPACLDRQPCLPFLSHLESDTHLLDESGHQGFAYERGQGCMFVCTGACLFALARFGWPKAASCELDFPIFFPQAHNAKPTTK